MVKDDVLQYAVLGSGHRPPQRCLVQPGRAVILMGWASAVSIMQEIADRLTCIGRLPQTQACGAANLVDGGDGQGDQCRKALVPGMLGQFLRHGKKALEQLAWCRVNPCSGIGASMGVSRHVCHLQRRKLAELALFTSRVLICKVLKARWAPVGNAC